MKRHDTYHLNKGNKRGSKREKRKTQRQTQTQRQRQRQRDIETGRQKQTKNRTTHPSRLAGTDYRWKKRGVPMPLCGDSKGEWSAK